MHEMHLRIVQLCCSAIFAVVVVADAASRWSEVSLLPLMVR